MKLQGTNLEQIQQLGAQVQQILSGLPQVRSIFAERVSQGFYINVEVNRPEAAKYGLTIADVQQAVESGIGGMNVAENIEGRRRYPINVRYQRDFRDNVEGLSRVLIATPSGAQIPIFEVAKVSFSRGPAMIRDEDGQLTISRRQLQLLPKHVAGLVYEAAVVAGVEIDVHTYQWSGEYEFQLRAKERLKIILPVVFFVIFMLLYMVFHSVTEAMVLILPTFYAMTGGPILQWLLGYNFSVAVWVGYIALFGIAVETGVKEAVKEASIGRVRPKLMTASTAILGLMPLLVLRLHGTEIERPLAIVMVGGLITSTLFTLLALPFYIFVHRVKRRFRAAEPQLISSDAISD